MAARGLIFAAALAVAGVYFALGKFGLSLAFLNASASAVWPPTGFALAVLLIWGNRLWPGILLGAFFVNITTQWSLPTSLAIACGNTLEAVAGAWLVRRFAGGVGALDSPANLLRFVLLGAILSTAISATVGVTSLCLGGFERWDQYGAVWLTWYLGDAVSDLIFAPLLLIWLKKPLPRLRPARVLELTALLVTVVVTCQIVFLDRVAWLASPFSLEYLALLPVLWAAFRFDQRGATICAVLISGFALWGTLHGFGPFVTSDPNRSLVLLQAFMGTAALTALVLAAVVFSSKEAQQTLKASEARKAAILESALDAIITINHQSQITEVNSATEKIFGYRREEMLGKPMYELIVPERLRERHRQGLAHYLATGEGPILRKRIEMPALRKDGTEFPVELTVLPIQQDGSPFFTATLRDLTEHKQAEESVREAHVLLADKAKHLESLVEKRTAELRELVGELEAFSYSMAHDMRAPLRGMQGFAEILETEYAAKLDATGRDYLSRIVAAASRLDHLTQDVLQYSKMVRGELPLGPVNLDALVRDIIRTYPNFDAAHVSITIEGVLPTVIGNIASLTQALSNLLGNAVKFVEAGVDPKIRVWAEEAAEPSGSVRLWIQDNGIGIAKEAQKRIFQMFQQLNRPERYEGTGMGLAIVRKAIERMGGTVGVESEPGKGSAFWIQLKRAG